MPEIDPDRFSERVQTDGEDVVVLDVRHEEDFDDWHIPDSVNIDVYDELTDNPEAAKDDLQRDRGEFVRTLASDIPDHPPNFERVKRTNVGQESVPDDELADLEMGPNNCAAE